MLTTFMLRAALLSGVALSAFSGAAAAAQSAEQGQVGSEGASLSESDNPAIPKAAVTDESEIIVTARRRDETMMQSPVVLTAVSGEELRARAITSLNDVARVVPQLVIGNTQSVQGGSIAMRGIGSSESNPFADQAVAFNIDGVLISRATVQRMAVMDLDQIVAFKGPQALFFGKNSPGGVIDIRTADPTRDFDARASIGYEFNGREVRGDGFVSGPLSDTLGLRIAVYGSDLGGYSRNITPAGSFGGPIERNAPDDEEYAGRVTLKFDSGSNFIARLKVSLGQLTTGGVAQNQQLLQCPTGMSQLGSGTLDCGIDDSVVRPNLGPAFGQVVDPRYGDGIPYLKQDQLLAGLELTYDLNSGIELASTTGYYSVDSRYVDTTNGSLDPARLLANYQQFNDREFSQELRAVSDFDGLFNFATGVYYQHVKLSNVFIAAINANAPVTFFNNSAVQKADAYSAFAQLLLRPVEKIEFSVGGRYSTETKRLFASNFYVPITTPVSRRTFGDFSPEATVTWRPSDDFTLFGSYKRGFLSGGFGVTAVNFATDRSFEPQTVEGFEVGAKAALLDRQLRVSAALYDYDLRGLQVQTQVGTTTVVTNAGEARVKGLEFDFNWRTPVDGLTLTGDLALNSARYDVYAATCYAGQTPALGCNLNPNAAGTFTAQDLAGRPLARSPEVVTGAGFDYLTSVSDGIDFDLNGSVRHSSSYFANPSDQPSSLQRGYWLFDAGARLIDADGGWELALIGRNLTNKLYISRANDVTFTGGGTGTPAGRLADISAIPSRGRELWIRFTLNPARLFGR